MKYGKAILSLLIIVGVIGGYLSAIATEVPLAGALVGALLGVLVYYVIQVAVSRRGTEVVTYDSPDGHKQTNISENTEFQLDSMKIPRYR